VAVDVPLARSASDRETYLEAAAGSLASVGARAGGAGGPSLAGGEGEGDATAERRTLDAAKRRYRVTSG
jgi:hypothetical protein